ETLVVEARAGTNRRQGTPDYGVGEAPCGGGVAGFVEHGLIHRPPIECAQSQAHVGSLRQVLPVEDTQSRSVEADPTVVRQVPEYRADPLSIDTDHFGQIRLTESAVNRNAAACLNWQQHILALANAEPLPHVQQRGDKRPG